MSEESLYNILPNLGCSPLQDEISGMTYKGLIAIVFPNGEAMFEWFKGFSDKSLAKLSILSIIKPTGPGTLFGGISAPIGLPTIPGINQGGKGK